MHFRTSTKTLDDFWARLAGVAGSASPLIIRDGSFGAEFSRTNQFITKDLDAYIDCADNTTSLPTRWNMRAFHESLNTQRLGRSLLLAEKVESTQTFLERRAYALLRHWPDGMVHVAMEQTKGRGRGQNVWISPDGSLSFSLVLDWNSSTHQMVFVQYAMALSVVETIREKFPQLPVHIKWPNDIMAKTNEGFVKLGGILVNTSFHSGQARLVVGCGVNIANKAPSTSLSQLIETFNAYNTIKYQVPSKDEFLAEILTRFEQAYDTLQSHGFTPLLPRYYKHWMHHNQHVMISDKLRAELTDEDSKQGIPARITGITEQGFLKGVSLLDDTVFELSPGGNSFDLTKDMIARKQINSS